MSLQEELRGPPPAKLVVDHVSKWFRQKRQIVHALDDVSLEVAEGEFIVIVGPSGCGKSTLLDIIAGLEKPDKGQVMADNQPVLHPGRHRLVMFQESALFPWLNTFGNVMFGLRLKPGLRRMRMTPRAWPPGAGRPMPSVRAMGRLRPSRSRISFTSIV